MECPDSPRCEDWIRYRRYATHNLPKHMKDYLEYKSRMSGGILNHAYFTKMAVYEHEAKNKK